MQTCAHETGSESRTNAARVGSMAVAAAAGSAAAGLAPAARGRRQKRDRGGKKNSEGIKLGNLNLTYKKTS